MNDTRRDYQDGETLFSEGDTPSATFTLVEGAVELSRANDGAVENLGFIQPGETFGDELAEGGRYRATARAIGAVVVTVVASRSSGRSGGFSLAGLLQPLTAILTKLSAPPSPAPALSGPDGAMPVPGAPIAPPPKMGLFQRLVGSGTELAVRVGHFRGADAALSRDVAGLLARRAGIRTRIVNTTIDAPQLAHDADDKAPVELVDPALEEIAMRHLTAITDAARAAGRKEGGDLFVWGHVTDQEHTLTLYFTSTEAEDEDQYGLFQSIVPVVLPLPVQPEWGDLLYAALLCAATPKAKATRLQCRELLPAAMAGATALITNLPHDLSLEDQAMARLSFANITARVAAQSLNGPLFGQAASFYQATLDVIKKDTSPLLWGLAQRNLGMALGGLADAGGDTSVPELTPDAALAAAAEAYQAAGHVLSKSVLALVWAAMQNRLGVVLYKLDAKANDADALKATLSAYQDALQVFSQLQSPLRWAEVMHNLAQAAQVLGEQIRNKELLQKAVDACRAALKVRRQETHPRLWAATQNNLGSALFLLGRTLKDRDSLEQAADAFAQVRDFHENVGNAKVAAIAGRNLAHVEKILSGGNKTQPGHPPRMKWEPTEEKEASAEAVLEAEGDTTQGEDAMADSDADDAVKPD